MGRAKYQLQLRGETLLQRICRIVKPEVCRILIVAAADQEIPRTESNLEVLRDEFPEAGLLAGVSLALSYLQTSEAETVAAFVASCDVPLPKPAVISLMRTHLTDDFDAVVVRDGGFAWPLCAIYRITAANTAAGLLASGQRRAAALPENLRTCWLSLDEICTVDPQLVGLVNCNTLAEVENALRHSGTVSHGAGQ